MPELHKEKVITLATDDYRGIYLPGTEQHEQKETQQVFSRTQDSAYMIKERVMIRMLGLKGTARPNILFDGITYENRALDPLIQPSKENFQCMVACLPEAREAPSRAFGRALTSTNPADKGRFVNTEALLAGHKSISGQTLIDGVPTTASSTKLMNTYTSGDGAPEEFGNISHQHIDNKIVANIQLTNLETASNYFGKQNLNPTARMRQNLYSHKTGDSDNFKYNNYHKMRSILSLASLRSPSDPAWKKEKALVFGAPPYLDIKLARDEKTGQYYFDIKVLDEHRYKAALNNNKTPENKVNSALLKELVTQAKIYNKLGMNVPFTDTSVNTKILAEKRILGAKNLEKAHLSEHKLGGQHLTKR